MNPERRTCARRILYSPEYLDMGADNGGVVVNLSEGGLGFQAVGPVEADSQIPLSFSLGPGYRIEVKARVVWVDAQGKVGGAVFGQLSKDSSSLIHEWLSKPEFEHETESMASVREEEAEERLPENESESNATQTRAMLKQPAEATSSQPVAAHSSGAAAAEPAAPIVAPAAPIPIAPVHNEAPVASASMPQEAPTVPAIAKAMRTTLPTALERKRERQEESTFSAVPSLSAWSRKDTSAGVRTPASSTALRPVPLRNAENIFARSRGGDPERSYGKRSPALLLFVIMIAAAISFAYYLRAHRRQIGEAIVRIGNSVAGTAASASTPISPSTQPAAAPPAGTASTTGNAAVPAAATAPAAVAKQEPAVAPAPRQLAKAGVSSPVPSGKSIGDQPARIRPEAASSAAGAAASLYSGQAEYQRAENYLNGKGVAQDSAEAAEWFWRSLEAGNTDAAVPLADLYLQGNGVSHSCTQARILLDAAAQKNNSQAIRKLAQLPESCQ